MTTVLLRRNKRNLELDKSAWLLCRFLCRNLSEENFEKVRDHVSTCKGVKTRLKLSDKGVEIGYKPGHVRHFHHKIKYEILPLAATENMIQDITFINVLLCIFHVENLPDLEFEIVAFKFPDNNTVKSFQNVCNILIANLSQMQTYGAPGNSGNITLMPSKSYHMGSLAPEKWGSVDRLQSDMSEISFGRSGRGVYGYGTIVPGNEVQRRAMNSGRNHPLDADDGNDEASFASSGRETFREVAVSANLDRTPASHNARPLLNSNRAKPYIVDGNTAGDAEFQVGETTSYPNYMRAESGSVVSGQSSSVFDDNGSPLLYSNGVSLAHSRNRPRNNNITLTSMEVTDNGDRSKRGMTSIRRMFKKGQKGRQTPLQSVDQFQGSTVKSSSRSDIYPQADAISVRSQGSYYLVPSFKKVYAPRSGRAMSSGYAA